MKIHRLVACAGLTLSLAGLTACGSSSSKASSDSVAGGSSTTTASVDSGQSAGGGGKVKDVCTSLTVEGVSAIVGGTVTVEDMPGGGCRFAQDNPRSPSASFDSVTLSAASGGFDAAKQGITGTLSGTAKDVAGVGDKAIVVVGTNPGGEMPQGGGLVQVGSTITQVTLTEGTGMSEADVETMTTALLKLAADKS